MILNSIRQIAKRDYLLLVPIMGLAFYIAYIPHLNYPYPVHIDEWLHLACSQEIVSEASALGMSSPFSGGESIMNQTYELGYHLFWATFRQISGISWFTIYKYFAGMILMITVLAVYVLARRHGFGWEAALLACLVPTTVGVLGPAFMVPIAMGLLFIPLGMFVVFNYQTWWSYLVLFIFLAFLVTLHAWTAIGLVIILVPYILINLKKNFRHSLALSLVIVIPFLVSLTWATDMALPMIKALLDPAYPQPFVDYPHLIRTYGYLPLALCLLGTLSLSIKGGNNNYGLALGLLALAGMLAVFFTLHWGSEGLYARGLVITMFVMSIVAGAGLMWVKKLKVPDSIAARLRMPSFVRNIGYVLCPVLVFLVLYISIPALKTIPYYHMIDDEDFQAFVWIKENVGSNHERAILDPWKGTAFTAVTERYIYSRIHCYPEATDQEAYMFLHSGSSNTTFLRENRISIVYSTWEVNNPDLVEVRENVYLLEEGA